MSTPALTTTIVATETVPLTIPILVGLSLCLGPPWHLSFVVHTLHYHYYFYNTICGFALKRL